MKKAGFFVLEIVIHFTNLTVSSRTFSADSGATRNSCSWCYQLNTAVQLHSISSMWQL